MKKKMKRFEEGGYTGDDEIVKYRMGMIDAQGNDLTKPAIKEPTSRDFDMTDSETPSMDLPAVKTPKAVTRTVVKTKVEPAAKKDEAKAEKKPYIDIPKDTSIGLRQFRSDGVSPMERLFKSMSGKSQRTTAAEKKMAKGGSVKSSASKRADGCAQRGKTKGRMV
jgi:hypothetical protein